MALDVDDFKSAENLVGLLKDYIGVFKIGNQLFTSEGTKIINMINKAKARVFLDLKFHDIPNTVKGAAKAATDLGVSMFNVHASGGLAMMKAAIDGINESNKEKKPKVIAVTILTSIDENILNNEIGISGKVEDEVLKLALLTKEAGLDGVVCSAADLYAIKDKLPPDFMFVTPGIKGPNTPAGADQKRVFTPGNAIKDGSTILVIGKAITGFNTKEERQKAAYDVLQDMAKNL